MLKFVSQRLPAFFLPGKRKEKVKYGAAKNLLELHSLDAGQHGPFFLCPSANRQQPDPLNASQLESSDTTISMDVSVL